jgi:spore germination cell wall hydrolase CwlJ-like protein
MFLNKKGIISLALTGCLLVTSEFGTLAANPQSEAQAIETISHQAQISPLASVWEELPALAEVAEDTQEWNGKALANTNKTIYVYKKADKKSKVVGTMKKNTVVNVEEVGEEWTKVSSGKITGYVKNGSLLTGTAAVERAEKVCKNGTSKITALKTSSPAMSVNASDEKLLATIIWCEAGNQARVGKVAVGAVVLNRVRSPLFPNSIREVIYQGGQFTPVATGVFARALANGVPESCYEAARAALAGENPVGNCLFFQRGGTGMQIGDHRFR